MTIADRSVEQMRKLLSVYQDQKIEDARTLPAEFYAFAPFFNYECDELLRREWLCVGRSDEIPEPGDYFTTELLNEPLLLVRGDDRRIRVLINVCRHRGMLVANGAGHTRHFVCPYHAWTYDREGQLLRAPRIEKSGHFDPTQCRLPELATETWQGFVFVNMDGNAGALAPRLAGLDSLIANYETDQMHHALVEEAIWGANWKCVVENFLEAYHLSVLHKETLHAITPTSLSQKFTAGSAYTGYKAYYTDAVLPSGACSPRLDERERRCSTLFCVYPTLLASQAPERVRYMTLQPVSVDSVRIRLGTANYEAGLPHDEILRRVAVWHGITSEDRRNLERLQRGYSSRHPPSGPLAPTNYEGTLFDFYQYLAGRLGAGAKLHVA
jgi:phenylpropionate dioxygenase-like ring-hydroxylating dioxygenase large terminal subunit